MRKQTGLWIDHRESIIVTVTDAGEETRRIESGIEKHVRFSGKAQDISTEDMQDRRYAGQLNKYYDKVIAYLRDAESIFVLGPGEAKVELEKRLEGEGLKQRVVGVEAVDKLTDRQIAAKIRQRFEQVSP
jgi:hypothetical protein